MKWQPIETAPKDGSALFAAWENVSGVWQLAEVRRDVHYQCWRDCTLRILYPTHWLEGFEFPDTKGVCK